jgi:hypothetical protein
MYASPPTMTRCDVSLERNRDTIGTRDSFLMEIRSFF